MPGKKSVASRRIHERKHRELRRLCYKIVREKMPDLWAALRIACGLKVTNG